MRPLWFAVGLAIPVAAVALLLGFRGPDTRGVRVERFTLHSRLVHRDLHEVLVMADDTEVRRNRLRLLHDVRDLIRSHLGDLAQIPR